MTCSCVSARKIIKPALFLILLISFAEPVSAQNPDSRLTPFINDLKNYFFTYYSQVDKGKTSKPASQIIEDIKAIASKGCGIGEEALRGKDAIGALSDMLDEHLMRYGKSINIFTVSGSETINCWFGELADRKNEKRNVWSKDVQYTVNVMDRLIIHDFNYFLSDGKEALDIGTRGGVVYYNLDAYRSRAASIWDFFAEKENKARRYDPSKANRLRKKLFGKIWLTLYLDCVKSSKNDGMAKEIFVDKAVTLLKEASLAHEIGHIFAERYFKTENSKEEEVVAFLTELRYGPLPYESLDMVISASYQSSISAYNAAGREIISSFLSYIQNEQKNKSAAYQHIDVPNAGQVRKMENLFKLTEDQIHSISEYIFKEKFEGGESYVKDINHR